MKITKTREGDHWRLIIDGRRSGLLISKGPPPRYREPQDYDLTNDADDHFMTGRSVSGLIRALEDLDAELHPAKDTTT